MEVKHSFLVETCLLTHGLRSIADDEILSAWPDGLSCITWVDEGSIRIGSAAEYILFRRRCRELDFGRIDSEGLEGLPRPEPWRYAKGWVCPLPSPAAWAVYAI